MNKNNSIEHSSAENISIECNSIKNNSLKTIDKKFLSEQTKFRLSEIIGIENYFYEEINQRKSCSKEFIRILKEKDKLERIKENLRSENKE